jgi:hypothetical protein
MEHSAQNVHLCCVEIKTVSKLTEMSFHLTHITKEYHQVCPKWFLSLWYVQRKLCMYIASRLTQSINGRKHASSWPTSPRSTIGCTQNDFWASFTFSTKQCTYLASRLALSPNRSKRASTWPTSRRSIIRWVQNDFSAYGMFGANREPILRQH